MAERNGDNPKDAGNVSDPEDTDVAVDPTGSTNARLSLEEQRRRLLATWEKVTTRRDETSPRATAAFHTNVGDLAPTRSETDSPEVKTDEVDVADEDIYFELATLYFERTARAAEQTLSRVAALRKSLNQEVETKWG